MGKRKPIFNRWNRLRHGDDTGHLCDRCDEPMLMDRFGGGMRARCNACGRVEQLADLGALEDGDTTMFVPTDPRRLEEMGDNETLEEEVRRG